jgi:hypothetical protein
VRSGDHHSDRLPSEFLRAEGGEETDAVEDAVENLGTVGYRGGKGNVFGREEGEGERRTLRGIQQFRRRR